MNQTFERVAKLLAEHKGIDVADIKQDSSLTSLGLDSLDTVELIMQFEEEFGISLSVSDDLTTVGDFVNIIEKGNN